MNLGTALAPVRPGGRPDRRILAISLVIPSLTFALTVQANPDCDDLHVSVLPEPAWHFRDCLVNPSPPAIDDSPAKVGGTNIAYAQDVSPVSNNFVSHPLTDFSDQSVLGAANRPILGMDFDPTGTTLLALANSPPELGMINLSNGTFSAIGPSVPASGQTWTGLAIHPVTGVIYASATNLTSSSLYTLNPGTGMASLVGTDNTVDAMIAIAINCEGEMYGHDIVSDSIYEINRSTGGATLVGPTGVNSNFGQGMDFDNESGLLYAWTYQGLGDNQYGTINLATGALTTLAINTPEGQFEAATQTTCEGVMSPIIFVDGFESGDTSSWSGSAGFAP